MGPLAALLPCGQRLHLQHGPIDLIIGADGDRHAAFSAAQARFETVLAELSGELADLRLPLTPDVPVPLGRVAQRMDRAIRPFCTERFVTRMAAVAGSVADTILDAMKDTKINRAYVNNGGDIAIHLTLGQSFSLAMADHAGGALGQIEIRHSDPIRGIATSGRHGRSQSLGIADSVTVLAANAAAADVAATLIANAVDLPDCPAIIRKPAHEVNDDSDLKDRLVVTALGPLREDETAQALQRGAARAANYLHRDLIFGAALFLNGQCENISPTHISLTKRILQHA